MSLGEIVETIEANNSQVKSLQGSVGVDLRPPGKKHFLTLAGRLNFARPDRLHLEVRKFGRLEFSLGSDGKRYWFWSRQAFLGEEPNTLWTGSICNIDRATARGLTLRPDILADALGVGDIRPGGEGLVVVPEGYPDRYVLDYLRVESSRLRLIKKTFLDRFAGRVTHIDYFAPNGTHIIRATFEGKRVRRKLRMPRRVLVELPLSQAAIRLDLGRLRMNPDLPPEAFEQPAFDSATHIDIDAEPAKGRPRTRPPSGRR